MMFNVAAGNGGDNCNVIYWRVLLSLKNLDVLGREKRTNSNDFMNLLVLIYTIHHIVFVDCMLY